MLNKLRSFSKGKLATILVAIIIVPFVFWGMGSVFSGGNINSIAKINNFNISTKDFVNYINNSKINSDIIKENISNNILEELLTGLVSDTLIDLEIKDLNILISDNALAESIKKDKNFHDEKNKFSRLKYEKFILENNISVTDFEIRLKKNELKKELFKYISGGIKSPYFIANKTFRNQTKEIELSYLNLNEVYKKKDEFTNDEIETFIKENDEKLKTELIDFTYVKITPQNLVQEKEFSENFFSKIDELENQILNGYSFKEISSNLNLQVSKIKDFKYSNNQDLIFKEIYQKRDQDKIQIVDKNDFYLLYEIESIKKVLPEKNDFDFIESVKNNLFEKNKFDYNSDLLLKIQNKSFKNYDFIGLVNNKNLIKKIKINSIKKSDLFTSDSIKLLYSLPENNFLLMSDKNNNVYLSKIENVLSNNLSKNTNDLSNYTQHANIQIRNDLSSSYNSLVNDKYKIKINQNTLERFKNNFR
jgi:peptidyl-prolyl cis-trans isomerase D